MNHTLNGIALQLSPDDRHRLEAICAPVELLAGQTLEPLAGGAHDAPVYFLNGATVCLWLETGAKAEQAAVALVGCEGMVGCSHLWSPAPWQARVLTPGAAWVTSNGKLRALIVDSQALLLAISQFLWQQTLEIAQLHARMLLGDLRVRVALWLHLIQHKTGRLILPITHESLARMLGTRRVSVTLLLGEMQSEGIIALRRGEIEIKKASDLARIAGLHN